jgi:hypothetical protein
MREFSSFAGFAEHLVEMALALPLVERASVEAGTGIILQEARESIGHYQEAAGPFDAWAPLADTTLNGFDSKGHHFPGKIELGYAPPDNPLLREGDLRGSDSDIAVWQELGTSNAKHPIPPRSVLGRAAFVKGDAVARSMLLRAGMFLAGLPARNAP